MNGLEDFGPLMCLLQFQFFWWKSVQGWIPVEVKIQSFGITLASKCQCCEQLETQEHVLLFNPQVLKVWIWFSNLFSPPCLAHHSLLSRFKAWWNFTNFF